MTSKRQLTLHFDDEVAAAIEAEAGRRGLNLSRAANDVLRRALIAPMPMSCFKGFWRCWQVGAAR